MLSMFQSGSIMTKNVFEFVELVEAPTGNVPRFLKASKKDKMSALKLKGNKKIQLQLSSK